MSDMPGSAKRLSEEVQRGIEPFEKKTGWRVTPQAIELIRILLHSMETDKLGFVGAQGPKLRQDAIRYSISTLPDFLMFLRERAGPMAQELAAKEGKPASDFQEIGALLVTQNVNAWADRIKCSCWPR